MKNLLKYSMLILTILSFMGGLQSEVSVTVSDQISTDTEFYIRELSVFLSKLATIEYSIKMNRSDIGDHLVCLAIYTTKDDRDLKTSCIHDSFGQLGNEDLHSTTLQSG